jgi:hypothetical protein
MFAPKLIEELFSYRVEIIFSGYFYIVHYYIRQTNHAHLKFDKS